MKIILCIAFISLVTIATSFSGEVEAIAEGIAAQKAVVFGVVAPSKEDPTFLAAKMGAEQEAASLSKQKGVNIRIDWHASYKENAHEQAIAVQQLVNTKVDGIAVSPLDAKLLTPSIDKAVESGVQVVTLGIDAPQSKRLALLSNDDDAFGREIMKALAKEMGFKGVAAILAGDQNSPKLRLRLKGIKEESILYPGLKILDTYYCRETPEDAALTMTRVMVSHPEITGWALMGSWPLYAENSLKWEPGAVKVVTVGEWAQIRDVKAGLVQVVLVDPVYQWGAAAVQTLFEKVVENKEPKSVFPKVEVATVDKSTVEKKNVVPPLSVTD
jgi:ribose transport system substrate-binding protein